jgi:two-component system chemotaxis response regulator CheV
MIEDQTEIYDDELIRLVSSNANTSSQYVIFTNSKDDYFAINVAKVEELITAKEVSITKGNNSTGLVLGISKIRDNLVTMCSFDAWLGVEDVDNTLLKLVILANYSNKRIGILIKNVIGIQSFEADQFLHNSDSDEKTIHVIELGSGNDRKLCKIFDSDRFIFDLFPEVEVDESDKVERIDNSKNESTTKKILLAEDSKLIQKSVKQLFDKLEYNYEMFENGKTCLERIKELDPSEIGLIITDIEMPIMDGITLLTELTQLEKYNAIPKIVNTNMANSAVSTTALKNGALEVVKKLDLESLSNAINKYALK